MIGGKDGKTMKKILIGFNTNCAHAGSPICHGCRVTPVLLVRAGLTKEKEKGRLKNKTGRRRKEVSGKQKQTNIHTTQGKKRKREKRKKKERRQEEEEK